MLLLMQDPSLKTNYKVEHLNVNKNLITTLCTKISKNTGIIFKICHNLNKNTVLLLYRSLIHPYLDYCNIIWAIGRNNNLEFERLFRKQTKKIFVLLHLLNGMHIQLHF